MGSAHGTPSPDATPASPGVRPPCRDSFGRLRPDELIGRYRGAVERIDPRVLDLDDARLDRWFDADRGVGLWSCRALLTHLMDVEILYTMRLRRTLAEENPVLENWDEQAFLGSRLSQPGPDSALMPAGACLAVIHTLRQTTATTLVQLGEADWARRALNPHLGEATLAQMLAHVTWHLEHHATFLRGKLDAMLGPAPAPDPSAATGCGAGCACAAEASAEQSGGCGGGACCGDARGENA